MPLNPLIDRFNAWIHRAYGRHIPSTSNPITMLTCGEPTGQSEQVMAKFLDLQITSVFQRVVDTESHTVHGQEAWLRVTRDRQAITPSEAFDSMTTLETLIGFDRLCRIVHALNFMARGTDGLLFVRVHPRLLTGVAEDHGEAYARMLRVCGLSPRQVIIEIPDEAISEQITDQIRFAEIIRNYRRRGFRVAMDGLAINNDTLERFWQLWPDIVKLDGTAIVRAELDTPWRRHLVRIIALIHELYGIEVVAQGITNAQQAEIARECGADMLQGDYFGRPSAAIFITA